MQVEDVMTREVLTVAPDTPIREVAAMLVEHRISGVPVCDADGRVLGVVSEGDILYKEHDPTTSVKGGPLAWLVDPVSVNAVAKARAGNARQAMTAPAITIGRYRPLAAAAQLMVEQGVNRLPVVEADELVGIVTRADLVRAFTRPDEEIEREIREDVLQRMLWLDPLSLEVEVEHGHVRLAGTLKARSDVRVLERLTARVPGVVDVESALTWSIDDSGRAAMRALSGF